MIDSNYKRRPKLWPQFSAHASWGDLQIQYTPIFKLMVSFPAPLETDFAVEGLVTLPARQNPQQRSDLYALAINRYNKVILADDMSKLHPVQAALSAQPDVLVGDGSSAITTAAISGVHAAELLSRGTDVDAARLEDGAYVRCQLDQAVIVIHRDNDTFWVHWPEPLTEYVAQWIGSIVALKRD
jgi:sarcosine oxidase gamma subunit